MLKYILVMAIIFLAGIAYFSYFSKPNYIIQNTNSNTSNVDVADVGDETAFMDKQINYANHPMAIANLRARSYSANGFVIEEQLVNGSNYEQYIASYLSEGLKIYGLLTVPLAERPSDGYPSVLFIHGYIPPAEYSTTGNYPTYQARLARAGFITFKPDLRGHGNSEGEPVSAHYSEKYVVDTLYALENLKLYEGVDTDNIFYWGHSNGGQIGLRTVVISDDIKAASFWAGVVGSYEDMFETYNPQIDFLRNVTSTDLVLNYGLPSQNKNFWKELDPFTYLNDINIPIQIQHGTKDDSVPLELSLSLKQSLEALNKDVEYFEYPGDDHNIGQNTSLAFERVIEFYRRNID